MIETDKFKKVEVASTQELRTWLEANHAQLDSIWIVRYKKSVPEKYISQEQVLDEILCYGWIDGLCRKLVENRTMQLLSPRRAQHWALSYKQRAEKLIASGKMHEAGLEAIQRSKTMGLWEYMEDVDSLTIPDELKNALEKPPSLVMEFESLPKAYKRNLLRWLKLAKTQLTRDKRISAIISATQKGERIPQM
jgi:uncharacterized protein YdeI (YjbR/CyaY-like superfamily)